MNLGLYGVNADFKHQYLVTCFIVELTARFDKFKTYKDYVAFPEYDMENGKNPDVSIYICKSKELTPIVVIEICRKNALKDDLEKVRNFLNEIPSLKEGYVLDWENFKLYIITRKADGTASEKRVTTDQIHAVSLPLKTVIERYKHDLKL